jgi:hypothetical protein
VIWLDLLRRKKDLDICEIKVENVIAKWELTELFLIILGEKEISKNSLPS